MIDHLYNWLYFILSALVYLAVIIYTAMLFGLFKYIASQRSYKDLKLKVSSYKLIRTVTGFINVKIKPVISLFINKFFQPAVTFAAGFLQSCSVFLINISSTAEKSISEFCKEGFELIAVLSRRIVYAESGSIWKAFLAFLVLFYFILTNL